MDRTTSSSPFPNIWTNWRLIYLLVQTSCGWIYFSSKYFVWSLKEHLSGTSYYTSHTAHILHNLCFSIQISYFNFFFYLVGNRLLINKVRLDRWSFWFSNRCRSLSMIRLCVRCWWRLVYCGVSTWTLRRLNLTPVNQTPLLLSHVRS